MSEYICPICGGEVEHYIAATYPPISHYRCLKCGMHKDIRGKVDDEKKFAPFNDNP